MRASGLTALFLGSVLGLALAATPGWTAWSPKIPVKGVSLEFPDRATPGAGITGLEWDAFKSDATVERTPGPFGTVRARLHLYGLVVRGMAKSSCELAYPHDQAKIPVDPEGRFEFIVSIKGVATKAKLACISDLGTITYETLVIRFPTLKNFLAAQSFLKPKRLSGQVGLGATYIDYYDIASGITSTYKSLSMTLTGGVNYWVRPGKWMASLSGFFTVAPVTRSGNESSSDLRFLGINARMGYSVKRIRKPWGLTLSSGLYYVTTMVNPGTFGFKNMGGPQFYPSLRYVRKGGDMVTTYFKFSPVASNLSLLSLSNREVALGLHYIFGKRALGVGVDLSDLGLRFSDTGSGESFEMRSRTISLGVSKSF